MKHYMKKLVILMLALLPITAHADEGMWTIYNLTCHLQHSKS